MSIWVHVLLIDIDLSIHYENSKRFRNWKYRFIATKILKCQGRKCFLMWKELEMHNSFVALSAFLLLANSKQGKKVGIHSLYNCFALTKFN